MKGADYWEQRAIKDKKFATNKTEEYINSRLTKAYSKVSKELEEEISELYKKLDKSRALLSQSKEKLLTSSEASEIKELLKLLEKEKAKLLEAAELPEEIVKNIEENIKLIEESLKLKSTNGYITHLELMNERINSLALSVANENQINMYGFLSSQYKDNYFRGVFRVQQGIGFGKDFISPNPKVVQGIIMKKFAGSSFSKRIWKDANKLATTLKDTLTNGLIRGESIDQMTKRLLTRIDASKSHARTLIRTESARIYEEATKESYKECGIEKYIFLATLDRKTSLICQELDMKSFPLDKAKAGENYPPMHPNCRSTTMADTKPLKRLARGSDGKNYTVDGNLSYKEWYEGLSSDEQGRMKLENKKDANKKKDKEELNEIRNIIGKHDTPSLAKYQEIKYNKTEEYRWLMGYKEGVKGKEKADGKIEYPLHPLTGFENYKARAEDLKVLIGLKTVDGSEVKSFSTHMVERFIGQMANEEIQYRDSVQRKGIRFGVKLEEISNAIQNGKVIKREYDKNGVENCITYALPPCKVTFNPMTGNLIQVNPISRREK